MACLVLGKGCLPRFQLHRRLLEELQRQSSISTSIWYSPPSCVHRSPLTCWPSLPCRKTVLEYGFHALRDEKKRRYVYFRDSFQANNSNTSPALPASSQSAFASPGVQSQPSGTYGGPQRAGSQQPGGEAATASRPLDCHSLHCTAESLACD